MHRLPVILAALFSLLACSSRGAANLAVTARDCVPGGQFRAELYGALQSQLDWRGDQLHCEGMPRPQGEGARLRFAGEAPLQNTLQSLAIIVALPELEPGATGRELRATVTLIEEDNGRFFSNAEQETCWADVNSQQALGAGAASYAIAGIVYCLTPLPELNSNASITIRDLQFTGRVDWRVEQP